MAWAHSHGGLLSIRSLLLLCGDLTLVLTSPQLDLKNDFFILLSVIWIELPVYNLYASVLRSPH